MEEIITRIEKLNPHPTEAITLFFNFDTVNLETIQNIVNSLKKNFPKNIIVALPYSTSLESCSKDILENIISMITMIIELL